MKLRLSNINLWKGRSLKHKAMILLLAVVVISMILLTAIATAEGVARVNNGLESIKGHFTYIRWGLLSIVFIAWNGIVDIIAVRKKLSPELSSNIKEAKLKVFLYISFVELFIISSFPSHLLDLF